MKKKTTKSPTTPSPSRKSPAKSSTKKKGFSKSLKTPPPPYSPYSKKEVPKTPPVKGNKFVLTGSNLTVNIGGETAVIAKSHPNFNKVLGLVKSKHWSDAAKVLSIKVIVKNAVKGAKSIIEKVKGKAAADSDKRMEEKVASDISKGHVSTNYDAFYKRCEANPKPGSIDQLFDFLKYMDLPILESGSFLAYKHVDSSFMDHHTGKFDNSIGKVVKMDRSRVTYDPSEACSAGLHVGAKEYVTSNYSSGHLLLVEVDPANVVSVPKDYSFQKMRVCEYKVVKEIKKNETAKDFVL